MQTGALGATASVVIAVLAAGCAAAPAPAARAPAYFRSPPLDYRDPGPTSSDGEVMGAHQRNVDDLMLAGASSQRLAPGWHTEYGQLYFERNRARAGYGVLVDSPSCYPSPSAAPAIERTLDAAAPEPQEGGAGLQSVWRDDTQAGYSVSMTSMAAELRREQSSWLECDNTPAP